MNLVLDMMLVRFRGWLDGDAFPSPPAFLAPLSFTSMRQFIRTVALGDIEAQRLGMASGIKFPTITDLNMLFSDFLALEVICDEGQEQRLETEVQLLFCVHTLPLMAFDLAVRSSPDERSTLFGHYSVDSVEAFAQEFMRDCAENKWPSVLMAQLREVLGQRTLASFFVRETPVGQFPSTSSAAAATVGRPLPVYETFVGAHRVTLSLSVFPPVDEVSVGAVHWEARLFADASTDCSARVSGVIYVFDRADGALLGTPDDIVRVADTLCPEESRLAHSFVEQHADHEQLIADGDLCFVSLWDRRVGSAAGLGALCLTTAVAEIARRYARVKTLVIETRPTQFWDWPEDDPPVVALAKLEAMEQLESYVAGLNLAGLSVRHVFSARPVVSHGEMSALAEDLMERLDELFTDSRLLSQPALELDDVRGRLVDFFAHCGLDVLADRVDDGTCAVGEVLAALKHQFLDSRMLYVRAAVPDDIDGAFVEHFDPLQYLRDSDERDYLAMFLDDLPDGVLVSSVLEDVGDDDEAFPVCVVVCETVFGPLVDYYTLVPKPRPTNVSRYLC